MAVRRYLRYSFFLFVGLDIVVLALVTQATVGTSLSGVLIDIRNAAFGKFVSQRSEFEAPPADLIKNGFLTDPPSMAAKWKPILNDFVRYHDLFEQLDKTSSTIEKAKLIALSFSRNGTPVDANGIALYPYGRSADLLFKFSTIREPRGFCSDHAQVFMALASVAGLHAMQVECAHTTSAIYCPEFHKWVWIDSEFALLAKKPSGEYMSPLEVRDANLKDEPFDYEFFGTPDHVFAKVDPRTYDMYRPKEFSAMFGVEWGNEEFTRDAVVHQFLFVPKPIREFFMIVLGTQPTYRYLNDDPAFVAKCLRIRVASYGLFFLFLIGNLAFPFYYLVEAIKRRLTTRWVVQSASVALPDLVLQPHGQNVVA